MKDIAVIGVELTKWWEPDTEDSDQDESSAISRLTAIPLHTEVPLSIGSKVFCIGNPLGLSHTLSEGIVSGYRKKDGIGMIQITAPISPGSSGGPVLTDTGRALGIVTASRVEGQNINFAVPCGYMVPLLYLPFNERPVWRGASLRRAELHEISRFALTVYSATSDDPFVELMGHYKENEWEALATALSSYDISGFDHLGVMCTARALMDQCIIEINEGEVPTGEDRFNAKLASTNKYRELVLILRRGCREHSSYAPIHDLLSRVLSMGGNDEESLEVAEHLVKLVPRSSAALNTRANSLASIGRLAQAAKDYQEAIRLDPFNADAHGDFAQTLRDMNEHSSAAKHYMEAGDLGYPLAYYHAGLIYEKLERYHEAITSYKLASQQSPGMRDIYDACIRRCTKQAQ